MATNISMNRMTALDTGTNVTSGSSNFYSNDVVSGGNDVLVFAAATNYSFSHQLRMQVASSDDTELSNIVWASDGNNGYPAGLDVEIDNQGLTFAANIDTPISGSSIFGYTLAGTPFDGSVVDTGPWTVASLTPPQYIGDLVRLQAVVAAGTVGTPTVVTPEPFFVQVDVV